VSAAAPRSPWWTTVLLWAGLAVLAVILAAVGLVLWVGHNISRSAPQPDVAAFARSRPVQRADRATSAWFGGQLQGLSREAPWLRPAGQSVHDQCRATAVGVGSIGGVSSWITTCTRQQTGYYAYAGGGNGRVAALEHALAGLGWRGFTVTGAILEADYTTEAAPAPRTGLLVTWLSPATPRALRQILTVYEASFAHYLRAGADGVQAATPPNLSWLLRAAAPPAEHLFMVTLQGVYATSQPSS
jgi:hypothetical protein